MRIARRSSRVAPALAALALAAETVLAAFPGANGRISFDREDVEVFSILPDGTGETNLTDDPADDDAAAWSPDGTRIVFSSDRAGDPHIWVMDADGQNPVQVTSGPNDDHPAWSPDGTRIVFQREQGDDDVWVVNVDGSGETNLTNDPDAVDEAPAWSPDGTRIAFCSGGDIWLMNPDGTGKTNLTDSGSSDCNPNWSPDGTKIAFDSDADGDREIVVMNADGSGQAQRTFNGEDDQKPAWSPDGTKIVFEAARGGDDQIHVIDAAGGNETAVTDASNPDDDREPDWQPLAATTTTVGTTTTTPVTTTTLPGGTPAAGRKLVLGDKPGEPQKRALVLLAKDRAIGAGADNDGPGDPVVHGGFLKVVSSTGDGFNTTYDLPADRWRYKGKPGRNKGYKLSGAGPIRTVQVKLGKTLKVVARGDALGHSLGADPAPVHVALGLGAERYCFTFGGRTKFKAGKQYQAKNAPVPGACAALVPACGDRLREAGEACPTLEGPEDELAIDAVFDLDTAPDVTDAERDVDADGRALVRTYVEIGFAETATVGQVNALLARIAASIVGMVDDVAQLVVRIPDPGNVAALDSMVAGLEDDPVVRFVRKAYEYDPGVLPPNYSAPLTNPSDVRLDHHLAVGAAAAWNARGARSGDVPVLVMDWFGNGPPDAALVDVSGLPAGDFGNVGLGGSGTNGSHGYHVLGIIAANFGGDASGPGQATGMVPGTLPMRVVDRKVVNGLTADLRAIQILKGTPVAIFSTSIIYTACNVAEATARADALSWVEKVRGAGLEDRVLHLTCAGNVNPSCTADVNARKGGPYAAAALLPLTSSGGATVANLANVLAIENAVNTPGPVFAPQCLSSAAKFPGHLAGIGTSVFSLTDRTGTAGDKNGCSMATPQVAGLAAYLWSLAPAMKPQQVVDVLQRTALPLVGSGGAPGCATVDPKPVVDAYAAVLALDQATLPTPDTAPVRNALLDVDDQAPFDENDLLPWVTALIDPATGALREPSAPGYGRFDLNGDGFTGGATRRMPFDLDRAGSTQFGVSQRGQVTQSVEGVTVPFDEAALTDLEILCYYAYSGLYDGDPALRRERLGLERCSGITMTVDFPSTIVQGTPETLLVTVGRDGASGSQPVAGLHIELSPTGGTVVPQSGTTDAQGELSAEAGLASGSDSIEIIVQALNAPGGEVLAEDVVFAAAPCTDAPTDVQLDFGNGEDDPTVVGPTLRNGVGYRLTTSGTYTVNSTQQWASGVCKGTAAAGNGGPTGLDTEFFFAVPVGSVLCGPDFQCCPNHTEKFQISLDDGGAFTHVEPVSPGLSGSHVYEYLVQGQGLPVHLRLSESNNRGDDYGIVSIDIACASDATTTTTTSTTTSTTASSTTTTAASTTTFPSTSTTPTTSSTSTTTLFGVPVIPYARYAATGPDGPFVMLEDEFVTENVNLGAVSLHLPPVTIDGLAPFDPFTSQTCHAHPGGTLDECIDIQDLFGVAALRIGNPVGVCVPELFPGLGVDAFKCYAATGSAPEVEVALNDEFQSQTVTVGAPELLCTPVAIDAFTLVNPLRYLVCYATAPLGAAGGPIQVENDLHPNPIPVDVGVATGLCVPAVRQVVPTCQLCGNGVLDGAEDCDDANLASGDGCSAVCQFELDCTCNGLPLAPPDEARCGTLADCGGFCTACATGGGVCGCQ